MLFSIVAVRVNMTTYVAMYTDKPALICDSSKCINISLQ